MRLTLSMSALLIAAAASPSLAQTLSPDATLWGSASKGAAGELQLYLGQYPTGGHAAQAKAALAALNAAPAAGGEAPATASPPAAQPPALAAPPANLAPGWLVEVRAMHNMALDQDSQDSSGTSQSNSWQPDPVALSIKSEPGPDFDIAKLAAAVPGAGTLPAIAGSGKLVIKQAGQWGLGMRVQWTMIGPCHISFSVQGNKVIDTDTNQNTWGGKGDNTFSNVLALTPGVYDVAWTLACQPAAQSQINPDAIATIMIAQPGQALEVPNAGMILHLPNS